MTNTTPAPAVPVLPPLPKPGSVSVVNADPGCVELRNNYTVTQMHAYAIEYAAALEASRLAGLGEASWEQLSAAAKTLAERLDYPWEHMPEKGRNAMREHVKSVLAAISAKGQAS